jgi:TonB family protein
MIGPKKTFRITMTRKFLLTAIALSLAGHLLFLGASGFMAFRGPGGDGETLTLYLDEKSPPPEDAKKDKPEEPAPVPKSDAVPAREDRVSLTEGNSPYRDYLVAVKRKIEHQWSYPDEALERGAGGTVVLEFAIAATGALEGSRVLEPSGESVLDREALRVIHAAAPFKPLPLAFRLTRLYVVAQFRYEISPM